MKWSEIPMKPNIVTIVLNLKDTQKEGVSTRRNQRIHRSIPPNNYNKMTCFIIEVFLFCGFVSIFFCFTSTYIARSVSESAHHYCETIVTNLCGIFVFRFHSLPGHFHWCTRLPSVNKQWPSFWASKILWQKKVHHLELHSEYLSTVHSMAEWNDVQPRFGRNLSMALKWWKIDEFIMIISL